MKIDWFDSEKVNHWFNQWKFDWFRFREWSGWFMTLNVYTKVIKKRLSESSMHKCCLISEIRDDDSNAKVKERSSYSKSIDMNLSICYDKRMHVHSKYTVYPNKQIPRLVILSWNIVSATYSIPLQTSLPQRLRVTTY